MTTSVGVDVLVSLLDKVTGPLKSTESTVARASERMQKRLQLSMHLSGASEAAARVATGAATMVAGFTDSIRAVERAKGELATLGVRDLDVVVRKGQEMQAQLAGITADAFVRASYDIKSGISSLTDQGVADMTASAMIVAKATKGQAEQMTSLFATSYGIFRKQMTDLTDAEFGEQFGAALAASVQQFKTDGSQMQQAIESAGAGAVNLGMGMTEQLALLGMMQQQMQAGEAGTALRAFAANAAKAHEAFSKMKITTDHPVRVSILDEGGQLRAMPDILGDLRARYGETLDAFEAAEIQKAFGTEEAMKLINALYGQEAAIRANADALDAAAEQGNAFTETMAKAADNNWDATATVMAQKFDLLKQKIGDRLLPVVERLVPVLDQFMARAFAWIDANPELVTGIGMVIGGIAATAAVLAPLLMGLSVLTSGWALAAYAATRFYGVLGLVIKGVALLGRALMLNPIGLIIMAIAGAAYLIYQYWEPISEFFVDLWARVTGVFSDALDWLRNISWSDLIPAFAWDTILTVLDWAAWIGRFYWSAVLTALDWATWIGKFLWDSVLTLLDWATWIGGKLDIGGWITGIEWKTFVPDFSWAFWVAEKLNLKEWITGFEWKDVIHVLDIRNWLDFSWADVLPDWDWGAIIPEMPDLKAMFTDAAEGLDVRMENRATSVFGDWEEGLDLIQQYRDGLIGIAEIRKAAEAQVATEAGDMFISMQTAGARDVLALLDEIEAKKTASTASMAKIETPESLREAARAASDLMERFPAVTAAANETLMAVQAVITQIMTAVQGVDLAAEGARIASSIAAGIRAQIDAVASAAAAMSAAIRSNLPGNASVSVGLSGGAPPPGGPIQPRASGGWFKPGWLLTGEGGPELEYRSEGGFIAHNRALRGMLDMARQIGGFIGAGAGDGAPVPALASIAETSAAARGRGSVSLAPHFNMPITLSGTNLSLRDVEAVVQRQMDAAVEMMAAEQRRAMND